MEVFGANTVVKVYDAGIEITTFNRPIFHADEAGRLLPRDNLPSSKKGSGSGEAAAESLRRSKRMMREIALANDFSYFATFTIDPKKNDAADTIDMARKMRNWLHNQAARSGLNYLVIGEYHKPKEMDEGRPRVHFHGLINDALKKTDSGLKSGKQVIYNLPQWRLGFTTAIPLYGDRYKALGYITKYLTKDTARVFGDRYLAGGRSLQRSAAQTLYRYTVFDDELGGYAIPGCDGLKMQRRFYTHGEAELQPFRFDALGVDW